MVLHALCTLPGKLNGSLIFSPHLLAHCCGAFLSTPTVTKKPFCNKTANFSKAKGFDEVPRVTLFPWMHNFWKPWRSTAGPSSRDEICETGASLFRKYGPILAEELPGRYSVVHLFSSKDFHTVYQEEGDTPFRMGMAALKHYRDRAPKEYADASILHLQGEKWNRLRCATQEHVLRNRAASSYASAIDLVAEDAVSVIEGVADNRREIPDCFYFIRRWALESITFICIGVRLGALRPPHPLPSQESASILEEIMTSLECLSAFAKTFPYYRYFPTSTWRTFEKAMDGYTRHITGHIKSAALSSPPNAILSRLLQEKKLDFAETVTFARDIILGGIETVASTATACLLHLAKHTEAQEKARSEAVAAFGKDGAVFVPEHLNRLPYLSACMKESMRMTPAVPGITRKLNHDTVISGYRIPAKKTIYLHTLVASQLEEHFSKPENFLPERWLFSEEKCDAWVHQTTASLPFGAGRRPCLGRRISELEIITLLSKILLKYRIERHQPDVEFHETIYMIPKGPTRLCFKPLQEAKHI